MRTSSPDGGFDQGLYTVTLEAWVKGITTRKVDAIMGPIGSQAGFSLTEVSRICQGLDSQIQAFLELTLDGCATRTST